VSVRTDRRDRRLLTAWGILLVTGAECYLRCANWAEEQKLTATATSSQSHRQLKQLEQLLTGLAPERSRVKRKTATAPRNLTRCHRHFSANKACAIPIRISTRPWNSLHRKALTKSSARLQPVEWRLQVDINHNASFLEANRTWPAPFALAVPGRTRYPSDGQYRR
jgi:hypothetical protein